MSTPCRHIIPLILIKIFFVLIINIIFLPKINSQSFLVLSFAFCNLFTMNKYHLTLSQAFLFALNIDICTVFSKSLFQNEEMIMIMNDFGL